MSLKKDCMLSEFGSIKKPKYFLTTFSGIVWFKSAIVFISSKDEAIFPKFHSSDWRGKFALLDKFQDDRLVTFGHGLIFNEAPEILPQDIYKKIKRKIASRILSTNKEKWWTVSAFYSECDEIRENEDKMFSFKTVDEKLKFLDGINDYVMNLEQKYSDA